jgi:hypothetical protein
MPTPEEINAAKEMLQAAEKERVDRAAQEYNTFVKEWSDRNDTVLAIDHTLSRDNRIISKINIVSK